MKASFLFPLVVDSPSSTLTVSNPSLKIPICLRFHSCTVAKWSSPIRARADATRIPQITVKNSRPKLPRVFLMLLTLITSEWDPALSLFWPFLRRRGLRKNPRFFLWFNFERYTFSRRGEISRLPRIVSPAIKEREPCEYKNTTTEVE